MAIAPGYSNTASMLSRSVSSSFEECRAKGGDLRRLAQHADDQVDDVAAQLEHDPAAILRQGALDRAGRPPCS